MRECVKNIWINFMSVDLGLKVHFFFYFWHRMLLLVEFIAKERFIYPCLGSLGKAQWLLLHKLYLHVTKY